MFDVYLMIPYIFPPIKMYKKKIWYSKEWNPIIRNIIVSDKSLYVVCSMVEIGKPQDTQNVGKFISLKIDCIKIKLIEIIFKLKDKRKTNWFAKHLFWMRCGYSKMLKKYTLVSITAGFYVSMVLCLNWLICGWMRSYCLCFFQVRFIRFQDLSMFSYECT